MDDKIAVFRGKQIRKIIYKNEWWFSIADVVAALTDSADTKQYIKKMRQRDTELNSYWGTICTPLELVAPDGKGLADRESIAEITRDMIFLSRRLSSFNADVFHSIW
jgi:prophage antirepressor-like protein